MDKEKRKKLMKEAREEMKIPAVIMPCNEEVLRQRDHGKGKEKE